MKVLEPKKELFQYEFLDGIEKTTKGFLNEPSHTFFDRYSKHSAELGRVSDGWKVGTYIASYGIGKTDLKSLIGDICNAITDEYPDPNK